MKKLLARLTLPLLMFFVLVSAAPVYAATNPFGDVCDRATDSTACRSSGGDPITGTNGALPRITTIIAIIAGIAAVIIIILAGIRYITSNGDAEAVAKAKRTIILTVVGLVIIVMGRLIINFVLNRIA